MPNPRKPNTPHNSNNPHNTHIHYDRAAGTILLDVHPSLIQAPASVAAYAKANGMIAKPEYHITLIGSQIGSKLVERCKTRPSHWKNLAQFCDNMPWNFTLLDSYYALKKTYETETRKSIIQEARLPSIATLTEFLQENMGIPMPSPFSHVTLYSASTNPAKMSRGIAVYSRADLDAIATKIR
ncbi:MAG TPA: hypothetical protein VK158_06345 [Acidobacteriota bacterium]|nr:hypothetical protein [Acidobacteriota bacterium]